MPEGRSEYIQALARALSDYYAWVSTRDTAFGNIRDLAAQAADRGWTIDRFLNEVKALRSYARWQEVVELVLPPDVPPEEEVIEEVIEEDVETPEERVVREDRERAQADLLAIFQQFLVDNELPSTLIDFIRDAIIQNKSRAQIILELRQTPEYQAAYPENRVRRERGLSWMPEAEIRAYRDEAKRLAREYMGVDATNAEVAELIGRGTSLRLWEHRLQINRLVEQWGGAVQSVFESYLGAPLADERLHAFFDPDVNTPDLDRMYRRAIERGQPAQLGFGIRPEAEVEILEQYGLSTEQIFRNYQQIYAEIPRFERLAAIGGFLQEKGGDFFGDVGVQGSLLFRAVQLGDPKALEELRRQSVEESVRFRAGGGPAQQIVGLPSLAERR